MALKNITTHVFTWVKNQYLIETNKDNRVVIDVQIEFQGSINTLPKENWYDCWIDGLKLY